MKKHADLILTLLLFSIVLFLSYKYYQLNNEYLKLTNLLYQNNDNEIQVIVESRDEYFDLTKATTLLQLRHSFGSDQPLTQLKNSKEISHTIVIFLDVDDCGACFSEGILWEELYMEFDEISVFAIISGKNQAKVEYLLRRLNINIPFFYDPDAELAKKMGLIVGVDTPLKLIVNKENVISSQSRSLFGNRVAHEVYKNIVRNQLESSQISGN